jgi:hypothetical protein
MVAAIGSGATFAKGRDFGAWLGLVPKQVSTGDRTILGSISKRGNRYLRSCSFREPDPFCYGTPAGRGTASASGSKPLQGGSTGMCW